MKRLTVVAVLFAIALASCSDSPTSSGDGRGACSHHGGVNCGAGPDSDGSVICNDGWRDSSVGYSEVCD